MMKQQYHIAPRSRAVLLTHLNVVSFPRTHHGLNDACRQTALLDLSNCPTDTMCRPSAAEVGRRAVTSPQCHRQGDGRGRAHPAAVELRGACFPAAACTPLISGLAACTRIYQPRIDQDGDKFPEAKIKCARRPISQAGHADDESCHHPRARGTGDVSRLSSHRVEQTQYPGQRRRDSRPQSRIWWSST